MEMNREEAIRVATDLLAVHKMKLKEAEYVKQQIDYLSKTFKLRIDYDENCLLELKE